MKLQKMCCELPFVDLIIPFPRFACVIISRIFVIAQLVERGGGGGGRIVEIRMEFSYDKVVLL